MKLKWAAVAFLRERKNTLITHLPSSPTYRKANLKIPAESESNYGFFKPSQEVFDAWAKTWDVAQALKAKVIVFQCPARFTPTSENMENMRRFFGNINREKSIFVWEPRGEWSDGIVTALCQDLGLVHCVNPLERTMLYGKTGYFRLHGGRNYRHQYADDELAKLWELSGLGLLRFPLAGLGASAHRNESYVLFNNLTMCDDALRFKELIEDKRG